MAILSADVDLPQRVIVTGGASGLGAAVVAGLLAAGARPAVIDLNTAWLPEGALAFQADVSDTPAVTDAVQQAAEGLGGIDAIVTAAGIDRCGDLDQVSVDDWELVIKVNLLGTVAAVRAALPWLKQVHGRAITVASSLGLRALPAATAYCASKFGVVGFSRALAAETRGQIGVTTMVPAGMKTHFFDDRDEQFKPQDDSRLNDPANVANAILFALAQPTGCEVREMVICHEEEDSWP